MAGIYAFITNENISIALNQSAYRTIAPSAKGTTFFTFHGFFGHIIPTSKSMILND
jgi:hypothetical protein